MKVYIMCALSRGIIETDLISREDGYVWVAWPRALGGKEIIPNGDVFESRENAVGRANVLRMKKIQSLERQIEKLRKMEF